MELQSILKSLNPRQKEAVEYNSGPCLIIAGAGTGKTKTLTSKIAYLIASGVNPGRILALTFTNKAAAEMRARVEGMMPGSSARVWMHTFHSFGVRLLRQHADRLGLTKDFAIYDEDEQKKVVKLILEDMGQKDARKEAGDIVSLISRAKDSMISPDEFAIEAMQSNSELKIRAADIYKKYEARLKAAGALDFGDLLLKAVTLLTEFEDVRDYYQRFFEYVLVDEYQDTNRTQYIITKTLAIKTRRLCVVGDPDQSIYSWRGATIRNILEFETDFPDAKVITLEQNYRSTQTILDCANTLIQKNARRKHKDLFSSRGHGAPIGVHEMLSEGEEARWIAQKILDVVNEGASLDDIAVFYRTNAQSRSFEDTFRRYQLPYRLIGAVRFYDRKEIKDALAYARVLINPGDEISLLRILNTPRRGLGQTSEQKIAAYARENGVSFYHAMKYANNISSITPAARRAVAELVNLIETLRLELTLTPPSVLMEKILNLSGFLAELERAVEKDADASQRIANLNELVNAAKEYEDRADKSEKEPSLSDFVQEISLITGEEQSEADTSAGAVTLMTVHLAKGLEFPIVFVSGLEEGLFPLSGKDGDDLEEERRLCYVAMTRAKDTLYMTSAATRRIFGKMFTNLPSRFLFDSGLLKNDAPSAAPLPRFTDYQTKYGSYGQNKPSYGKAKFKKTYDPHGYEEEETLAYNEPKAKEEPAGAAVGSAAATVGRRVRHGVFGEGKITAVSGSGDATKITVIFTNGVKRMFLHKYAPLELV